MEPILLLVNSAPSNPNAVRAFQSALTLRSQGHEVSIFLVQDAVLSAVEVERDGASPRAEQAVSAGIPVYALGEDLALRGFASSKLWDGIRVGDYGLLVDLFDQHGRIIGAL